MRRVFSSFFITTLILLTTNIALALESEYKNSLIKVELIKKNDSSYSIDLYTQKKYSEPVKVIKKSDLNYYILLPETKNSATGSSAPVGDIRNISVNLYPYVGQDANNGYTKININTTKPLNFDINVKQISQNVDAPKQNLASKETKNLTPEVKQPVNKEVQKKNFQEPKKSVEKKPQAKALKTDVRKETKKETKKEVALPLKKVEKVLEKAIVNDSSKEVEKLPDFIEKEFAQNPEQEVQNNLEKNDNLQAEIDEVLAQDVFQEEPIDDLEENKFSSYLAKIKVFLIPFKEKVSDFIKPYGVSLKEFALMVFVSFVVLFMIIAIFSRKQKNIKLKNKKDLFDNYFEPNIKKQTTPHKKPNNGEYFIFDKSIKQTSLNTTSQVGKNYELSSYEPDLRINYKKKKTQNKSVKSEYDIIQKILKEDSILDLEPKVEKCEPVQKPKVNSVSKPCEYKTNARQIQNKQPKKEEKIETQKEPEILSNVEIAPERGFMCVSYNDNINLMGYIFDDVFPLYNFKRQKLANYDIKFRLTEKDDKSASFIVKVENTKMVIRVSKHSMNLEVLI